MITETIDLTKFAGLNNFNKKFKYINPQYHRLKIEIKDGDTIKDMYPITSESARTAYAKLKNHIAVLMAGAIENNYIDFLEIGYAVAPSDSHPARIVRVKHGVVWRPYLKENERRLTYEEFLQVYKLHICN